MLGSLPSRPLPAQLRFREKEQFQALFAAAELPAAENSEVVAELRAPSPAWLALAPGMAALLDGFGAARAEVTRVFRNRLEKTRGSGRISLAARAYIGSVRIAHE